MVLSYTSSPPRQTACPDCDVLLFAPSISEGFSLYCPRCGAVLQKQCSRSPVWVLALSVTGLLLFVPSITLPLLRFDAFGFSDSANLIETVIHLLTGDYPLVALMVALFTVIFPLFLLLLYGIVSLHLHCGIRSTWTTPCYRTALHLEEWAMLEVYLLGILIAIIKMLPIADIVYLPGFFSFIILVLSLVTILTTMDTTHFWNEIEALSEKGKSDSPPLLSLTKQCGKTAMENGLLLCHTCHALLPDTMENRPCSRCGSPLHRRKPHAMQRTWALVITAAFLLFPANLLPVMKVDFFGSQTQSTILDGIIYFFKTKSYFVGIVICTASVLVPIFKVTGLTLLLLPCQTVSFHAVRGKTRLYRCISFIGRWSMLDIFVIALLSAMVDFSFVSTTWAAPACRWFSLVVAVTIFAAHCFDPRLLWDRLESSH